MQYRMLSDQRKRWIDCLRGFCMMAILLFHTEIYYTGTSIIGYNLYVSDALYLFFMLSGYLLYKNAGIIDTKYKLKSVLRNLLWPYFIFTSVMAVPKALAHGERVDNVWVLVQNVVTGQASWFIAALIVAEILFVITLRLCRGNLFALGSVCVLSFCCSALLALNGGLVTFWQFGNALQAMLFLFLGYVYHRYEHKLMVGVLPTIIACVMLFSLKCYVYKQDLFMTIWPIGISNYAVFLINVIVGGFALFNLFRLLPPCRFLEWTGRHSIVYYFLCGGVPMFVGAAFSFLHLTYDGNYFYVVLAYLCVCLLTTMFVYLIYRYMPFVTGYGRRVCN